MSEAFLSRTAGQTRELEFAGVGACRGAASRRPPRSSGVVQTVEFASLALVR